MLNSLATGLLTQTYNIPSKEACCARLMPRMGAWGGLTSAFVSWALRQLKVNRAERRVKFQPGERSQRKPEKSSRSVFMPVGTLGVESTN